MKIKFKFQNKTFLLYDLKILVFIAEMFDLKNQINLVVPQNS